MRMRTQDLIDYLSGQFNVFPDPNFIPDVQESQLPALFVFNTGGFAPHELLPIDNPTFQIVVKGKDYKRDFSQMSATEELAKSLINSLDKNMLTIAGNRVFDCKAMQSNPLWIGMDEHNRPTFSTNFRFEVKR